MGTVKEEIAKNICFYRKKAGYTQKALADQIGVKNSAISNWESGQNSIDIELLFKVCSVLGVSINDIYGIYANNSDCLTQHESAVILAYRSQPAMQPAVDRLLGVASPAGASLIADTVASDLAAEAALLQKKPASK